MPVRCDQGDLVAAQSRCYAAAMFRSVPCTRTWVGFLALLAVLTEGGCGGGTAPAAAVPATPSSNLSGNWLLAGSLPVFGPAVGGNAGFGLAADFNVIGNQVFGGLTSTGTCPGGALVGSLGFVSGTIAADGSFDLQTPALSSGTPPTTVVTIQGKVPDEAGAGWTGKYTISNPSGACPNSLSGAVTATSIPLLSGTFTGTANLQVSGPFGSGSTPTPSTPVPVTVTLQQSPGPGPGDTIPAEAGTLLTGSIALGGSSCLTSGTTNGAMLPSGTLILSSVNGDSIAAVFAMNDGSTLQMSGSISALDGSSITVQFVSLSNGTCPAQFSQFTSLSH